jgi:cation diffusion facilitator CzcD-associated flavoprotein CzcO
MSGDLQHQVVVIGAGPAGVSSALALKDVGVSPLVVDQAEQVASSWRNRYDRLRLNTWRRYSQLPDRPFPKGTPTFPSRDQVVEYLDRHAHEDGIELRLGTRVERLGRDDGGWRVKTSAGELTAPQVVVATGFENEPLMPEWPGRENFAGDLLHARDYRNPEPFRDRSVLVVGPGCTGMEISHDLADGGARKVWLAVRTPPNITLRQGPGPVPGDVIAVALWRWPERFSNAFANFGRRMDMGDLSEYGLPVPDEGVFTRAHRLGMAPSIVDKEIVEAIKDGSIEIVRAVESLDEQGVTLDDGTRLEPDAVICATGYLRGLEPLVGHLGVLGERGVPTALGEHAAAPGLRFVGYVPRPGGLGYMGKEAKRAAKAIARELRNAPPVPREEALASPVS